MDLSEKMVSSQTIFEGKIIKVTLDQARLPDRGPGGGVPSRRGGGAGPG